MAYFLVSVGLVVLPLRENWAVSLGGLSFIAAAAAVYYAVFHKDCLPAVLTNADSFNPSPIARRK